MNTLQRIFCLMTLLCLETAALRAQAMDTSRASPNPPAIKSYLVSGVNDTLWLSRVPTVSELTKCLAAPGKGRLDPFLALQAVISMGDSAVSALDSLLFSDPIAEIITTTIGIGSGVGAGNAGVGTVRRDTVRPNKLYAVMTLEAIGSKATYGVLVRLAQLHPNVDVRGIALRGLGTTFHESDRLQKFVPDKELLHVLITSVDDTTAIPYLAKSFGQVAREGLIAWLGQDFGEPQGEMRRLQTATGADRGSLADYREQWWLANQSKIVWDANAGRFVQNK